MDEKTHSLLQTLRELVAEFSLAPLAPILKACEQLAATDALLDVALLGQFNSGKSSLLNALIGEPVFPVGAVPVTSVVTRAVAGPTFGVRVTFLDGAVEAIPAERLGDYVTEAGNPVNRRRVAFVDLSVPALAAMPGLRLVDTPGLGSAFLHNSEATQAWLPQATAALVAISAERPFSEEDRLLIAQARQVAPRVAVALSKVDLLGQAERAEVTAFLEQRVREHFGADVPVLPFSSRSAPERWTRGLKEAFLKPLLNGLAGERQAALELKLENLFQACRSLLSIGLQAAERADADRRRLRAAVLDESAQAALIHEELRLAEHAVGAKARAAFSEFFAGERPALQRRLQEALAAAATNWRGNLERQKRCYEAWMGEALAAELAPLSNCARPVAGGLVAQAETRFRRILQALRERLARCVREHMGIQFSPLAWECRAPKLAAVPVALSQTFMIPWDLLGWLLPMRLVGGLFRRHVLRRTGWETEKNLARLTNDWARVAEGALADLRTQAEAWADAELALLDRLLSQLPAEAARLQDALRRLDASRGPSPIMPTANLPA